MVAKKYSKKHIYSFPCQSLDQNKPQKGHFWIYINKLICSTSSLSYGNIFHYFLATIRINRVVPDHVIFSFVNPRL